jgi:hypothetical protein
MKSKKVTSFSPNNRKKVVVKSPIMNTTNQNYDIFITAYIKNKAFKIYCGDGRQKIKWLMDVALHNYDRHFALNSGI